MVYQWFISKKNIIFQGFRGGPTFSIDILGQVWYLIVSIPDLCTLSYFGGSKCLFL